MMTQEQMIERLRELDIDFNSLSFFEAINEDGEFIPADETFHGVCRLTGDYTLVAHCIGFSKRGGVRRLNVSLDLIGDVLGKREALDK